MPTFPSVFFLILGYYLISTYHCFKIVKKIDMQNVNSVLVFFVNGKKIQEDTINPEWTLLYYLRNKCILAHKTKKKVRLYGTKNGCGDGGCGTCTVMVSKFDRIQEKIIHLPVNACLVPICSIHGLAITTVEGIGSTKSELHSVQERIAKAHGSQCGFCTPGIVMSMYTLLRNSPKPSMDDLNIAFQGNMCRCTGYRPIIDAYRTFTEEWKQNQNVNNLPKVNCSMRKNCSKYPNLGNGSNSIEIEECHNILFETSKIKSYDPSQEPMFPQELKLSNEYDRQFLTFRGSTITWYRPTTLQDLLKLKTKYLEAKIVVGYTEIGIEIRFKNKVYPVLIHPTQVPELTQCTETKTGVKIGAAVTISEVDRFLKDQIKKQPEYKTRIFTAMVEIVERFSGKQIRNMACLGGNIMQSSPTSDFIPVLMAAGSELELQSSTRCSRKVILDDKFLIGYKKNCVQPDEVLLTIFIPFTEKNQYFLIYKQSKRRYQATAIVNFSINVTFASESNIISNIFLGFGSMSFKTVSALTTQKKLIGLPWNKCTLEVAYRCLLEDLPLTPNAPGGMIQYRKSLSLSLFFKAYLTISQKLAKIVPSIKLDDRDVSGIYDFKYVNVKSSQCFTIPVDAQNKRDALQKPIVHKFAYTQSTGEAVYCDDIPHQERELYCDFVISMKAHANILKIDDTEALAIKGVHGFITAKDIDEKTNCIIPDEMIFYSDKVTSVGQIIGLIVAEDHIIAREAAKKVRIDYQELEPVLISIEDAIEHQSFFKNPFKIINDGNIVKVLEDAPHVIEGKCKIGGQEHFYLETQACIVIPKPEDDEMEIYSATQNPSEVAKLVSEVLGVQQNKIIAKVKRLGGAFGGKQTKASMIALPLAIAAKKFNRPIRCMLDRDKDIMMTGGRHPTEMKYKVGFNSCGKLLGGDIEIYSNCGYSTDYSLMILEKTMAHSENAYKIPAIRVVGYPCKTNRASNTACRGFGAPQGMFLAESIVQHVADYLKMDPVIISENNLYKEGDKTFYNQELTNCTIRLCWKECIKSSDYYNRRKTIDLFNKSNHFKKRGLSMITTKYGVGFTAVYLNQAGALVLVYTDGSVMLSHGGIEMGQGLHTKMLQIASRTLEIPVEKIHLIETSTDKVPNTSRTASSASSDLNGMAVLEACNIIKERLRPYKEANPNGTWEEWVKKAYFDRVSLSASGFHKIPDIGHDWETGEGNLFNYFTYGVACTEVEIDTLTGDHQVLRTDIIMDLGESLNPAIDIGQIEGAFVQGYGLFMLEEILYSADGQMLTKDTSTYKIPGFADIPVEFNVSLLKGASNPRAVYSSKAIGEPPLFLSSSVLFAVKDAIKAARDENGIGSCYFQLDAPVTCEKIRMACGDKLISMIGS